MYFVAVREEGVLVLEKAQKADTASLLADTKVRLTLALTVVLDDAKLVVQGILCGNSTKLVSKWDAADLLGRLNDNTEELVRLLGGFGMLGFGQLGKLC